MFVDRFKAPLIKLEVFFLRLNAIMRTLFSLVVLFVLFLLWYFLSTALFASNAKYNGKIIALKKEISIYEKQNIKLRKIKRQNPTQLLMKTKKTSEQELTGLTKNVLQKKALSVSPKRVFKILKDLIHQSHGLTLIGLKHLPEKLGLKTASGLFYELPVSLTLRGDFQTIYHYLKNIDAKNLNVYWDKINYKVTKYPHAKVDIRAYIVKFKSE